MERRANEINVIVAYSSAQPVYKIARVGAVMRRHAWLLSKGAISYLYVYCAPTK